jgi:hypothetical protein
MIDRLVVLANQERIELLHVSQEDMTACAARTYANPEARHGFAKTVLRISKQVGHLCGDQRVR